MSALRSAGLIGMVLFGVVSAVQAHHSTTVFDSSRTVTVTGTVAKLEWTHPHVFVWVNVPNARAPGRHDLYAFENASPNVLESAGWNRTVLKAGDRITVDYSPRRDGRNGGLWILGRLANGRVLPGRGERVSRDRGPARGAGQATSAQCPRAEVVEVMSKASTETRPVAYRNGTIHVSRMPLSTLADVVDNDAVLSVVLQGGFGIGRDGLQISVDRNEERIKEVYDELSRCVALRKGF